LQPTAKKVRRRHLDMLERIEKLWTGKADERALTVAWFGGFGGFTAADLVRGANVGPDQASAAIEWLKAQKALVDVPLGSGRHRLLHADMIRELDERILAVLSRLHEEFPLMTTHDRQKVQSQLDYVGDDTLVHSAVDRLLKQKRLVGDLRRVARADFKPKLSANLRKLKDKLVEAYREARFQPPEPAAFAPQAGGNAANLKDLFDVCMAEGLLVHIGGDIYLHSDVEADMRRLIRERLQSGAGATVAEIRDLLGTTRKYAVPLCEYLDSVGVTKREEDLRVLGPNAALASAAVKKPE
jgi:selenocysteine-specific elongation factor